MDVNISINNLKKRNREIEKYADIIKKVRSIDVSKDIEFQKQFTYFYRVRRNEDWRKTFYNLFEQCKKKEDLDFEHILRRIFNLTGRIEASFSSKMLATLNPQMPIWDSIVISKLGIKPVAYSDKEKRLKEAVYIYHRIDYWYQGFLQSNGSQAFIEAFDKEFPKYKNFSDVKKVDFLIWGSGDDNPIPQKVIKIDGCVEVPPIVTEHDVMDKFIKFVEANHWYFGGGVQEVKDLP